MHIPRQCGVPGVFLSVRLRHVSCCLRATRERVFHVRLLLSAIAIHLPTTLSFLDLSQALRSSAALSNDQ
jgi:hypothetical protein